MKPDRPASAEILSRIYIDRDGNLVVTDLWEELHAFFSKSKDMKVEEERRDNPRLSQRPALR